MDKTIEIPNNKREIIKYITDTCRINNINDCKTNCTTNLECLSNKCFNNKCIFNNENPIVHCDDIYDSNKISSYMYCGKEIHVIIMMNVHLNHVMKIIV